MQITALIVVGYVALLLIAASALLAPLALTLVLR